VHGGLRQQQLARHDLGMLGPHELQQARDREGWLVFLDLAEQVDDGRRNRSSGSVIGSDAGHKRVEAAAAVRA